VKAPSRPSVKICLKVVPGASSEGWEWLGDDKSLLKIRVSAAPEKGKANKAVEKYLAIFLGVPVNAIMITSGASSQQKVVSIKGLTLAEIQAKFTVV